MPAHTILTQKPFLNKAQEGEEAAQKDDGHGSDKDGNEGEGVPHSRKKGGQDEEEGQIGMNKNGGKEERDLFSDQNQTKAKKRSEVATGAPHVPAPAQESLSQLADQQIHAQKLKALHQQSMPLPPVVRAKTNRRVGNQQQKQNSKENQDAQSQTSKSRYNTLDQVRRYKGKSQETVS